MIIINGFEIPTREDVKSDGLATALEAQDFFGTQELRMKAVSLAKRRSRELQFENKRTNVSECEKLYCKSYGFGRAIQILVQESEMRAQYINEHKNGYCPKCFCLLPMTGICNNGCDD